MHLLVDVNVHADIVRWLRAKQHDVVWAVETHHAASDLELLDLSRRENRVLITGDLDFGELVIHQGLECEGLVLIRMKAQSGIVLVQYFAKRWVEIQDRLVGHFIVLTNARVRIRPIKLP